MKNIRFFPHGCLVLGVLAGFVLSAQEPPLGEPGEQPKDAPFLLILGIAQDAGFPQAACKKKCCRAAWGDPSLQKNACSIALVDPQSRGRWLFDITPDFKNQLHALDQVLAPVGDPGIDGIFLTHAHIGHYTGLMHLGREVMGAAAVPVHAMPRMKGFLETNGPWDQLVRLKNIRILGLQALTATPLNDRLKVTPFAVPHRDEYSETVGFRIVGPRRSAVFIPDIDKWERWETPIEEVVRSVDFAFLDGTFYHAAENPHRDMSEIPHPFIVESMARFDSLPAGEKQKIIFIHLNHTNPALDPQSPEHQAILAAGFGVARPFSRFYL